MERQKLEGYNCMVPLVTEPEAITDPQVAAFISDRARGRHLDPFLARERTIAEAAAELGISPQRMHYWVRQMMQLGLLLPVRSEVRGRSRTSVYRSSADTYHLPLEVLPTSDFETLELHFQPVWRQFLRSVVTAGRKYSDGWRVTYGRTAGKPAFHIEPLSMPAANVPLLNAWTRLELTPSQAQSLIEGLASLLEPYLKGPASHNARGYLLHTAVVEVEE